jgi:hypothetical protein
MTGQHLVTGHGCGDRAVEPGRKGLHLFGHRWEHEQHAKVPSARYGGERGKAAIQAETKATPWGSCTERPSSGMATPGSTDDMRWTMMERSG